MILQFGETSRGGEETTSATAHAGVPPPRRTPNLPLRPPRGPTRTSDPSEVKSPDQVWASPPIVTYEDGLLSVDAKNSRLIDVLFGIASKTGATIEVPDVQEMTDYLVVKIGPAPPSDIIATILQGSSYNYYVVENSYGDLQKVILTLK